MPVWIYLQLKKKISPDIYSYTCCRFYWEENTSPLLLRTKWIQDVKVSILIKQEIIFNDSASIKTSPGFYFLCGGGTKPDGHTPFKNCPSVCGCEEKVTGHSASQLNRPDFKAEFSQIHHNKLQYQLFSACQIVTGPISFL